MKKRIIVKGVLFVVITSMFAACVGSPKASPNDFVYNNHNFGPNRNLEYKAGVVDGCKTSSGDYTKNHGKFKLSEDYHSGWEHGRLKCKGNER
ncbi:hypothetical protein MNB_SV-6-1836 [hydrothermal vent metagenome]|uniref:Lipoprotein n=1 Tax=hydrothermal vent metagenome TaxID=652676 RepID=A0A1W1BB69_9ZZZZ